jgi:large repetitive protein
MKRFFFVLNQWARMISVPGLAMIIVSGLMFCTPEPLKAQMGVAPTTVPAGGCAIDGNLLARIPTTPPFSSSNGDFLPNNGAPGSGGFVFTLAGVPVDTATAFHIIDGYGASDATEFTGGSKFNNNPNTWQWKTGNPPPKDDMNNSLFFFSSDSLGNIWFVGSGDRKSTNGNTYLDFELLQNPLYTNTDGTFTSLGPDGGRTVGDLAMTITYTNGGSYAQLFVYQWGSTGQGTFGYVSVTPAAGTAFLATNKDSAIVVPYGAFGSNLYAASAFTEVACNLNQVVPGVVSCVNVKTVIVKTKASQSFNAELKDFITPVQVNIGSAPEVSVNNATICAGDSATLTATVLSGSGPFSYLWSTGDTTSSITVFPDTTTQYTVVVTGENGCASSPATAIVTVNLLPACVISGPDSICPSGTAQFSGADSLSTYAWTITGSGTIQGSSTGQIVVIQGTGACDSSFTLNLSVTGNGGCTTSCSRTIYLLDHLGPVINNVPGPVTVLCASQVPAVGSDSVSTTDNCGDSVTLLVSDQVSNQTCPNRFTVTRTWTATDLCGNVSTASQTISVFDSLPPQLQNVPVDTGVCCADSVPPPALVTAYDGCDGQVTVTLTETVSDSTGPNYFILTRVWTALDSCSNLATATQVIQVNDTLFPNGGYPLSNGSPDGRTAISLTVTPNPFINSAKITFSLPESDAVTLELYNLMGEKIRSLYAGTVMAGNTATITLSPDPSMQQGMYLLVLKTNHGIKTRQVFLMK